MATDSGWFSCRSACYLAMGKPVVVEDTGFSRRLSDGRGDFRVSRRSTKPLRRSRRSSADYSPPLRSRARHAERFFRAETVLEKLIHDAGL